MKRFLPAFAFFSALIFAVVNAPAAEPLRVFIRAGVKTHGPDQHDHPRFLKDWTKLLNERGAKCDGGMEWPNAEQLARTDVVVMYCQDGANFSDAQKADLDVYLKRGGGLVVIHDAVAGKDADWFKTIVGGAWQYGKAKWFEGDLSLYYTQNESPITAGCSNFDLKDELYYDLDMLPEAKVLASTWTPDPRANQQGRAFPHIYNVAPQMWTYESVRLAPRVRLAPSLPAEVRRASSPTADGDGQDARRTTDHRLEGGGTLADTARGAGVPYRAFVSIPGHYWKTFELPQYRAVLLRGIAWAGKRDTLESTEGRAPARPASAPALVPPASATAPEKPARGSALADAQEQRPSAASVAPSSIATSKPAAGPLDELVSEDELASLRYPPGGPSQPADSLAKIEVHPDFKMSLVAAEPLINKPICIDWDPSGKLWVAETPEYPNGRRGMREDYAGKEWKDHGGLVPKPGVQERPARDRISWLEDTDGDGVADKKHVFYEGLELVTGFVFHKDGVIVTQAPDILWLRDTDGDGKADKIEKLYTGLGIADTHAVINNPRWGWDGWIYATHGYSGSRDVTNGDGTKHFGAIGSGVVRFRPDGSAIEQYSSKGGNTWGLTITGDNRVMWTQPTSGQLLMQTVLPEYALARGKIGSTASFAVVEPSGKTFPLMTWAQQAYRQIDWVGSFTAAAGCAIYDGGAWPAEYNGDYFTTEPTLNIIHHARLTPAGSSFTAAKLPGREETEFVRSRDLWFRPIEVRVGPDGALYVLDFYNQAVIHNDTRGPDHNNVHAAVRPDRDHYFGRIWKIEHKAQGKIAVPDLGKASDVDLAENLRDPNSSIRMSALRLLAERSKSAKKAGDSIDASDLIHALRDHIGAQSSFPYVAALWAFYRIEFYDAQFRPVIENALKFTDADVRRNAALVAEAVAQPPRLSEGVPQATSLHAGGAPARNAGLTGGSPVPRLLDDPDAGVRLDALRALAAGVVNNETARALVTAWPKFDDDFQRSAAIGAASRNPVAVIEAALALGRVGVSPAGSGVSPEPSATENDDSRTNARPTPGGPRETRGPAGGTPTLPADSLAPLVTAIGQGVGERNDTAAAAKIVIALAGKPASADALKRGVLDTLAKSLKDAPAMTPELSAALGKLLSSDDPKLASSALPLAAKWDKAGALKGEIARLRGEAEKALRDPAAPDDARAAAVSTLLAMKADVKRALAELIGSKSSASLRSRVIEAIGESGDADSGALLVKAFPQLEPALQNAALKQLLKRPEWTRALIAGIADKSVALASLGPIGLDRLRNFPDKKVAKEATAAIQKVMGPQIAEKDKIIAALLPQIETGGDPAKGKAMFTASCAVCHKFNGEGAAVAPDLTGMGAHPRAELLTHIVDPNREVDPTFAAWTVELKDGNAYVGIITRENASSVTIRDQAAEHEVKKTELKTQTPMGRSLMPEGLEALGPEPLRDILAYLESSGGRFRIIDLGKVATADGRLGLFASKEALGDNLEFKKYGNVQIGDVPFRVIDPAQTASGRNLVLLKGGHGNSLTYPARVEIAVPKVRATALHFLGGVAGWGFPYNRAALENLPAAKVTVAYEGGGMETLEFKNGVEFVDYRGGAIEVPGSVSAPVVVKGKRMRVFRKPLAIGGTIEKLVLESCSKEIAPVFAAITAELSDKNAPAPSYGDAGFQPVKSGPASLPLAPAETGGTPVGPLRTGETPASPSATGETPRDRAATAVFRPQFTDPVPQPPSDAGGVRALLVGGGSSHDFPRWFGEADKQTLSSLKPAWLEYTNNLNGTPAILPNIDVLVLSANQPIASETCEALMKFANAGGKGIIPFHPGTWYAWPNFPQWNKAIIGGGTRGHDKFGEFEVEIVDAAHPVTAGLPKKFKITDELYNFTPDPAGAPIHVLAQATSPTTGKTFPQVWITQQPKSRIVCIALGHDAKAHELPEFQTLLKNAFRWASGK